MPHSIIIPDDNDNRHTESPLTSGSQDSNQSRPKRKRRDYSPVLIYTPADFIIPTSFYRYVDATSWNLFDRTRGFFNPSPIDADSRSQQINRRVIRDHLSDLKVATGLISVTSSKEIAENVAAARLRDGRLAVRVYEMSTRDLCWSIVNTNDTQTELRALTHITRPDIYILCMEEVEKKLGIKHIACVQWNWIAIEQIPADLVVHSSRFTNDGTGY